MKTTSLFQLGGIALILSGILTAVVYLLYVMTGQPSPLALWLGFSINVLQVLGFGALFARLWPRGGLLGLVAYVLLVLSLMLIVGNVTVGLEMAAGVITGEQIAQVPGFVLADMISTWTFVLGLVALGLSIVRSQVISKFAGVLVIVVGLLNALTGMIELAQPMYTIGAVVAWAWLGWTLLKDEREVSRQAVLATTSSTK